MSDQRTPSHSTAWSDPPEQPPTNHGVAGVSLTQATLADGQVAADNSSSLPAETERYRVSEEIGRGGMGSVLRGHDTVLKRDLAVKVLHAEHKHRPEMVSRFFEEAQIAGQLQHPGIVPIHDSGVLPDGRPFFTMKIVQGRTLADLLRERATPADNLAHFLHIFEQVCQAMAYAHARGVIHRDLKPANIMLGGFGEVQVMDWGLAKVLVKDKREAPPPESDPESVCTLRKESGDASQAGTILGTLAYMPPEQARGEVETLNERADVFGLGAILCQILTGQPPYVGGDAQVLMRRAVRGDLTETFARLDKCSADAELITLACSCLAAEREDRPRHAGEVAVAVAAYRASVQERLRAAETERAAAVARAEAEQRKRRAERRARQLTLGLAGVVVLALLAGGGAAMWIARREARIERDEAVRQAKARDQRDLTQQRVEEDLQAAEQDQRRGDWAAASGLFARAEGRLADGDFEDLRDRISQGRRRLSLVQDLEAVRLRKATWIDDRFDDAAALHDYPLVLAAYGFDVLNGTPEEVAARIQASPVREPLLSALDDWAFTTGAEAHAGRLLSVARLADDNVRRNQFRDLWLRKQGAELARLADEIDPADLSPAALHGFAWALRQQPAVSARLLRRALVRYPDDFWLHFILANTLRGSRQGDEEAVGYCRAALALQPRNVTVWNNLGNLLNAQGKHQEAEAAYRAAIRIKPDYVFAHTNLAIVLNAQGKPREAEVACREAIRIKLDDSKAYTNLGIALRAQGKPKEAEAAYREAIRIKPDDAEAHYNLGNLLNAQAKPREAESAFREAIRLKFDYAEAHTNLGNLLNAQGKPKEAETAFREAIRIKPDLAKAHLNLGNLLNAQGKNEEAEAAYREVIRIKSDDAEAHTNLAIVLNTQGKPREAEVACREAIRIKLDDSKAYTNLGIALRAQGKPKEAEAAYHEAIRIKPVDAEAHYNLGNLLNAQGKSSEAEAAYRDAIRFKFDYAEAHTNLGRLLNAQGKPEEAETAFREAIRIKPDLANAHLNLAVVLNAQGKPSEAEAACREAIRIKPHLAIAHTNLGIALRAQGKPKEAEAAYHEAIRIKPDDAEAHYNLGNLLNAQGKPREAEAAYREAIRLKPDYAEAHCNLGSVSRLQGRYPDSLASYRRGHELGSKQPGWRYPSAQWVREAERFVALDERLPAVLKGKDRPVSASEGLEFMEVCYCKKLHVAASRFGADAFEKDPRLANNLATGNRYDAACYAALAAAGKGTDAADLGADARSRLRRQALDWLQADLASWKNRLDGAQTNDRVLVERNLRKWKQNNDLSGVRAAEALARLPAEEREAWQRCWADVDALLERAGKP